MALVLPRANPFLKAGAMVGRCQRSSLFHQTTNGAPGSTKVPQTPRQGSTRGPPRFSKCHPNFVVSLAFWGRSVLGCQKVLQKVPPRFDQGSTNVLPRFYIYLSNDCCFRKVLGGFRQLFFTFASQSCSGVKVA